MNADIIIDNENLPISFQSLKKNKMDYSKKNISTQEQINKDTKIKKSPNLKDSLWNSPKN